MKSENKNTLIQNNIASNDKDYCNLRDRGDILCVARAKEYCESLWEIYRDYADPCFEKNFAKDFRARFWEMYLTCSLIELDFPVFRGKKSSKGPDICLKLEQGDVWIEAVAPDVGDAKSDDKVSDYELNYDLTKAPKAKWPEEDKIILRYRSAIEEKLRKYKGYVENSIVQPQQPYIIAINSSKIPYAFINPPLPLIVKAVFPFGSPFVYVDEDFELLEESFSYSYKGKIDKSNKSEVKTDIFLNANYSGISGILYSTLSLERASEDNAFGKASSEGYIFIHNPLAINRLPRGFLKSGIECFVEDEKLHSRQVGNPLPTFGD